MSLFGDRLKYVTCRIWDTTAEDFSFPELEDPEYASAELKARPNVGLAFSGGGTRSAAATLGQLRGLNELGLLDKVRYISCVSGAAFTCVPFTYLPANWTDRTFLGLVIPPDEISIEQLQQTDRNSFAHRIANSVIFDDFIRNAARLAGDETYSRALGDIFLNSLGLDSLQCFFSQDRNSVAKILAHNPDMTPNDFHIARTGRPYLIVNAIIVRTDNEPPLPKRIHFETTPLYAGAPVLHYGAGSQGRDIGGGYIEPFGFDSDAPEGPPNASARVRVRLGRSRHRYTLSDVMGTTGAAPAEVFANLGLDWLGLPEFKYWPPINAGQVRSKEYVFGDGGILENLGIMALLRRRVERIVVFVNTQNALIGGQKGQINDSIPPLFGKIPDFKTNQVFPESKYQSLVDGLLAAKATGKTVLFRDQYPVQENERFGVEGKWSVDVLWIYNERVRDWETQLPADIRNLIGAGSLGNFPHYRTFFQNPPSIIDLSAKQVSLLADLSCWNITENAKIFRAMFS